MENATKALYIAAGVLIGVMILSLAVMLFSSMQAYIQGYKEDIEYNALNTFNNKYQKYVDNDTDFTIQDVVTVAGMAYEDNSSLNIETSEWEISVNSLYVGVWLNDTRIDQNIKENIQDLLTDNISKKYKCTPANIEYNSIGRIYEMHFEEK